MAARNWKTTYQDYQKALKKEPSLSMAEFGRRIGENVNTARRALNKVKKELEGGTARSPKGSDRSGKGDNKRSTNAKPVKPKAKPKSEGVNAQTSDQAAHLDKSLSQLSEHSLTFPSRAQMSERNCRGSGHQGVTHGAYMDIAKVDDDIRDAADMLNQDDGVLRLQSARYLQLYRNMQEMISAIKSDYESGIKWKDEFGNDMPESKALASAMYGTSKPMTDLENSIQKMKATRHKMKLDDGKLDLEYHNAHPLSKRQQIEESRNLIQYSQEKDLTAVTTSYLFEELGLTIPRTLAAEADKEISLRQPKKEDLPEVTAEELDQIMEEFKAENKTWNGDWAENRAKEIEELKQMDATNDIEVIE